MTSWIRRACVAASFRRKFVVEALLDQVLEMIGWAASITSRALPAPSFRDEVVGVDALGQRRDASARGPPDATHVARRAYGAPSGLVRVEEQRDVRREAPNGARLLRRERGAERRDDVLDAARVQAQDVEVAFDDHGAIVARSAWRA